MTKQAGKNPWERIMNEPIRGFDLVRTDNEKTPPVGYDFVSKPERMRRMHPLIAKVASGEIPLDEHIAQEIADVLDHHAKQFDKIAYE